MVVGTKRDDVRIKLTQVPNTGWYETRAYQGLAVDVVSFSLQHAISNRFRGRTKREYEINL